ncbi:MAG: tryptophan-rich sensory protein [Xanthobacteraceae bacterium]|nr:tryptophan-rich sensory protein [Xanthobacteraceae bacterium]QYK44777.1 MAG: tryptophan-rich sensory protein [Xanthobacteraceae bacterium]
MKSVFRLLACLALCFAIAALGALATTPKIPGWYTGLTKPAFTPPNYLFPIVWNILYAMMAVSLWRLWQSPRGDLRNRAVTLFLLQLAVNLAWSWIFFGAESIRGGLVAILALDLLVAWTIFAAWRVDRIAAALLLPYLLWIGYATALNAEIVRLNA